MSEFDAQDERIAKVLGEDEVPEVNDRTLRRYLAYLKENLEFPCHLTGIEDFSWEERYVFGYGSQVEYEKLKKTQPSYTDTFEVLGFEEEVDEGYGILVKVKRVSDKKKFSLPLADLAATDEQSKNYRVLDDFSVWFVNYR
jgi:Calcium binding